MRAEAFRQVLNPSHAIVPALLDDVGGAEFEGELLPRLVPAHSDYLFRPELLGREHPQEANGSVTYDGNRFPWTYLSRHGGEPSSSQHIGRREEARNLVVRRDFGGRDEGAVGERDTG